MKTSIIAIIILFAVCGFAADESMGPARRYTKADIEEAILSGKISPEISNQAKKRKENGAKVYTRELAHERIPYQLFTFDLAEGYTVLIESSERIVVLCHAFGGGHASGFSMTRENGESVLHYRYTSGSGRRLEHQAIYILGTTAPKENGLVMNITYQ